MKRSEMEALIRVTIRNHTGHINEVQEKLVPISMDVLKTMEVMGILPPRRVVSEEKWVERDGITFKQGRILHRSWKEE